MRATPIAILGQGAVLPGALSPQALVDAVLAGKDLISEAPAGRWGIDPRSVATRPDQPTADRTWCSRGGYVQGFEGLWEPDGFAIPADRLAGLDPLFHQVLYTARQALRQAKVRGPQPRAGLVLGNLSFPTRAMAAWAERGWLEAAGLDGVHLDRAGLPPVDARNRFMSGLPAALAAEALELGLGGWSLDAACASGLYAIAQAAQALARGEADLMVAAAVNRADDLFIHIGFCALSAMSKRGQSRPFHREADGLVPAEGCAALVLKRHEDALRDGDEILAVVRGVGLSNDGRGRGLLAPSEEGQGRAIRAAYAQSGLSPADIGLVECHATGTPVGDAAELRSMGAVYAGLSGVPIGSLKSNLGHLVTVAGVAAVIKTIGAMKAGLRPATLHCEEPNPALAGGPFRLLHQAEAWEGPRRAAISAFGFGGNNAHLLLEDPALTPTPGARPAPVSRPRVVVAGLGLSMGGAAHREEARAALLSGQEPAPGATEVSLPLQGNRFPPHDLALTLPQHTLLLGAAIEAAADVGEALPANTGVFIGMGTDPTVARYGARWRLPQRAAALGASADWARAVADQLAPPLQSAAVLGTMPNLPANRISFQLGLGGPSFTVAAEQQSGAVALSRAIAALEDGELDAAVVGAVDLSADPLHAAAAAAQGVTDTAGDGAAVLILRREGEAALPWGPLPASTAPRARAARAWAAEGLIDAAARLLRQSPGPTTQGPTMGLYAAETMEGLQRAIQQGDRGPGGPLRLALVAEDAAAALRPRAEAALQAHLRGDPLPRGAAFSEHPVEGQLAAVFAGAGAAYPGMGGSLLGRWPQLGASLSRRFARWEEALSWARSAGAPNAQGQLWASSALCQLHTELTTTLLGLPFQSTFGYSSGETNSLLAAGLWADADAMMAESARSGLFQESLAGGFSAVASAWGTARVDWVLYWLRAPVSTVAAAVAQAGPRVHISIIHTDQDCVVAGERAGVEAVVNAVGRRAALPLPYPLAAHVPEVLQVESTWRSLHDRTVHPRPGLRVYSGAWGRAYEPDRERCATALTEQATGTLDLRPLIEAAYADGARIFVEHGPQGLVRHWIGEVLGERPHLAVSLDRRNHGAESTLLSLGRLWVAGVPMNEEALGALIAVRPPGPWSGPLFRQPAHPPALRLPPWPEAPVDNSEPVTYVTLKPATGELAPAPRLAPVEALPAEAPVAPAQPALPAPGWTGDPSVARRISAHMAQLSAIHQDFVSGQAALQMRFLEGQQRAWAALVAGPTAAPPPPAALPTPAPVVAPAPLPPAVVPVEKPVAIAVPVAPAAPVAPKPPARPATAGPRGMTLDKAGLMVHAGGAISSIFGPKFAAQDAYRRQCRMPLPPLLLADRMTGLAAEPASMGKGVVWTETDVTEESWYLNRGRMPTGILIESGQADLLLISYLGCDLLNRDERLYRLLGCEMTITGDLPRPGETLRYEIHVDGHARQGAVRLFFFHYDCHVDGVLRIQVRGGQAGFFTEEELATSAGILWTPEEGAARLSATARLDPPAVEGAPSAYTADAVAAFAAGRPWDCFGPAWRWTMTHLDTPRIQDGRMLFLGEVTHFEPRGGPWGRGYLRATTPVTPQDWFFEGHFLNDPCMPGTLMFEASVQTLSFFMAAMGFTLRRDGWRFQPVQNEAVKMRCRGQVTPQSKQLVYEIFVSEVHAGPTPRVWADLLCTVDGLKAFHAERFGLELVPGWPGAPLLPGDPRALRTEEGLLLDKNALLASAVGRPSLAFGPGYARFDAGRHAPRLPGPPYHFISRVVSVSAPFGAMAPNTTVVVELDLPAEPLSPAEQMEAALQPCGWLASWSGCTLSSPTDLFFRNLDGKGQQHRLLQPGDRRLTTQATLRKMARTAGMIIVHFEVACSVDGAPLWEMETSFGFFPAAALASQAGLTAPPAERDWIAAPGEVEPVTSRGRLWMIDRVTGRWPTGGAAGLGRIRGEKDVSPDAWYFKAHFYDDPVQPGSLGVEALMQLLGLLVEAQRPGATLRLGAPGVSLGWRYRGQVLPLDQRVTLLVEVTAWRAEGRAERVEAEGSLWVDGKRIYALTGLSLLVEPA